MRHKYRNTPVVIDGIRFDSKGEAGYWTQLKLREAAGEITDLERQVPIELRGAYGFVRYKSNRIAKCVIDFKYTENGQSVYVDFKGHQTDMSKLQHAILAAQGIEVEIVRGR